MAAQDKAPEVKKANLGTTMALLTALIAGTSTANADSLERAGAAQNTLDGGMSVMTMGPDLLQIVTQEDMRRVMNIMDDLSVITTSTESPLITEVESIFEDRSDYFRNYVRLGLISHDRLLEWQAAYNAYNIALTEVADSALDTFDLAEASTRASSERGENASPLEVDSVNQSLITVFGKRQEALNLLSRFIEITNQIPQEIEQET